MRGRGCYSEAMLNFLIAVDFSDATSDVVDYAGKLAATAGASLYLLHVVEPTIAYDVTGVFTEDLALPLLNADENCTIKQMAEARLQKMAEGIHIKWGVEAQTIAVDEFDKAAAIVEYAETHHADMIVVGNHNHSFLSSILLGSVAESVVRHSSVPVLVVPFAEQEKKK